VFRNNLARLVAQVGSAAFCFSRIDLPAFHAFERVSQSIRMLTVDEVASA